MATQLKSNGWDLSGYANDPAKLIETNKWIEMGRPIIVAMLALDDASHGLLIAKIEARGDRSWSAPTQPVEYTFQEARDYVEKAYGNLEGMLEGIRDDYLCDERIGQQDDDTAQDAADEFNDWLSDETLSVKVAINVVIAEHNAKSSGAKS